MPRTKKVSLKFERSRKRWMVRWRDEAGKDHKAFFVDHEEAEDFRREQNKRVRAYGWTQGSLSAEEERQAIEARTLLEPLGVSLLTAAREYARRSNHQRMNGEKAVQRFMKAWRKRGLREVSLVAYERHLTRWAAQWGPLDVSEASHNSLLKWMLTLELGPKTLQSLRTHLSVFYNYCVGQGWREDNPAARLGKDLPRRVVDRAAGFLTFDECRALLATMDEPYRPSIALQLFTGVRPFEIFRLTVEAIDWELQQIWIAGENAKTGRPRVLKNLPDNLWYWLEPLKVWPSKRALAQMYKYRPRIHRARKAALSRRWPPDALRHTFATYATDAAALGMDGFSLPWIRATMGHQTEAMLAEYEGVIRQHEDTRKFWALTPDNL